MSGAEGIMSFEEVKTRAGELLRAVRAGGRCLSVRPDPPPLCSGRGVKPVSRIRHEGRRHRAGSRADASDGAGADAGDDDEGPGRWPTEEAGFR